jgi:hypothetical protein
MSKEWNGSVVMPEFVKIAKEMGLISTDFEQKDYVGNPSESPTGPFRNNPSISEKAEGLTVDRNSKDYGITKETGKELIDDAHGKSPTVADAMGKGGLVENIVEQQEKDIEVALKMPNATLPGVHAAVVSELVRLADRLDGMGKHKEAMRVDETIGRLAGRPFELRKVAFWPMLVGAIAAGVGSSAWLGLGKHLTSKRESLAEDTKDLLEIFEKAVSKGSTAAEEAVTILTPMSAAFTGLDLKDQAQLQKYAQQVQVLSGAMPKLRSILAKTKLELGTGRWFHFGLDIASRMDVKMTAVEDGLQETKELLRQAQALAGQQDGVPSPVGGSGISDLQKLLFERGFRGKKWPGKVTGTMDETTQTAALELEKMLDAAIAKSGVGIQGSMVGKIVSGGKPAIEVGKLNRIIELLEKT